MDLGLWLRALACSWLAGDERTEEMEVVDWETDGSVVKRSGVSRGQEFDAEDGVDRSLCM